MKTKNATRARKILTFCRIFKSFIFFYILQGIFYVLGSNYEPLRPLRRTRGGTCHTHCTRMIWLTDDVEDPKNLQVLQEYVRGGTCPTPGSPQRPERLVKPKKFQAKSKNVRFFRLRRFYYSTKGQKFSQIVFQFLFH